MAKATRFADIPISKPQLDGNELAYVLDAVTSTWISSRGEYVERFERAFADFCGSKHAISCNTGTAALHLSLLAAGIKPGDEVIVPSLTYVATANAVVYCGARPVFADSDPATWTLDPADAAAKVTRRTRAIIAVHLFGEPADMRSLSVLANDHGLTLIEDAAEAHGARVDGHTAGSLASAAAFSFYGNKIITTGEGGMVTTDDDALARKARLLRGQGEDPGRRYWHSVVGYNYRMTNIEAAIGLAQVERVEQALKDRRRLAAAYRERLGGLGIGLQSTRSQHESANWIVGVTLPDNTDRAHVTAGMSDDGIQTRPFFYPVHSLPPYAKPGQAHLPICEDTASRGLCLPTWPGLDASDVDRICDSLMAAIRNNEGVMAVQHA